MDDISEYKDRLETVISNTVSNSTKLVHYLDRFFSDFYVIINYLIDYKGYSFSDLKKKYYFISNIDSYSTLYSIVSTMLNYLVGLCSYLSRDSLKFYKNQYNRLSTLLSALFTDFNEFKEFLISTLSKEELDLLGSVINDMDSLLSLIEDINKDFIDDINELDSTISMISKYFSGR